MTNDDESTFASEQHGAVSRRSFLKGSVATVGVALTPAGVYELIDSIARPPVRPAFAVDAPLQEQYIVQNTAVIKDDGSGISSPNGTILVIVHPLHNHLITARLTVPTGARALQDAQQHLESVLVGLEKRFPPTPTGLGIAVAWGLPYFNHYVPSLGRASSFFPAGTRYPDYMPVDLATSKLEGRKVYAVQESMVFPSDQPPAGFGPVRLEQNDVTVLLRSDSIENVKAGVDAIFGLEGGKGGGLLEVTSHRVGFTGGGFYGQQSLPSRLALAAQIPGAESIPIHAQ
ncbi:MAG TPA: twin-arginine translocation signal domain-containing protein, partial [Candidatus Dormibacteraeota bacterium]